MQWLRCPLTSMPQPAQVTDGLVSGGSARSRRILPTLTAPAMPSSASCCSSSAPISTERVPVVGADARALRISVAMARVSPASVGLHNRRELAHCGDERGRRPWQILLSPPEVGDDERALLLGSVRLQLGGAGGAGSSTPSRTNSPSSPVRRPWQRSSSGTAALHLALMAVGVAARRRRARQHASRSGRAPSRSPTWVPGRASSTAIRSPGISTPTSSTRS